MNGGNKLDNSKDFENLKTQNKLVNNDILQIEDYILDMHREIIKLKITIKNLQTMIQQLAQEINVHIIDEDKQFINNLQHTNF